MRNVEVTIEYEDENGVPHQVTAIIAPPEPDIGIMQPSIDAVYCDTLPDDWDSGLADDAIWQAYQDRIEFLAEGRGDYLYQCWKEERL